MKAEHDEKSLIPGGCAVEKPETNKMIKPISSLFLKELVSHYKDRKIRERLFCGNKNIFQRREHKGLKV